LPERASPECTVLWVVKLSINQSYDPTEELELCGIDVTGKMVSTSWIAQYVGRGVGTDCIFM